MCGLDINIASFTHLLKRVDFDAIVDHLALMQIIKSKAEPVTTRIKSLLELLSSYSFHVSYIIGKDMILSDFLSRQKHNDSDPHVIILILFNMQGVLQDNYFNIGNLEKYLVKTQSQAKASVIKLPEVQGIDKNLDPNIQPEKQVIKPIITIAYEVSQTKPRLGQRAGLKCKIKSSINKPIVQTIEKPLKIPHIPKT